MKYDIGLILMVSVLIWYFGLSGLGLGFGFWLKYVIFMFFFLFRCVNREWLIEKKSG